MGASIHATAIVNSGAELDEGVEIGPFAVIHDGVRLGAGCSIGPHVVIYPGVALGNDCRVHAGAVLGDIPQDMNFKGGISYVDIGNSNIIREGVTIHRGTDEGSCTVVGNDCLLMAFSHLGHNVVLGNRVVLANGVLLAGHASVGDGAFLSGNVNVHQFVRIGRLAMMGGGSGISLDLPPFCTVRALKTNRVTSLNVIGMRRAGITPAERHAVKRVFDTIYRAQMNRRQALDCLKETELEGPAKEFVEFIESSKRGICGFSQDTNEAAF